MLVGFPGDLKLLGTSWVLVHIIELVWTDKTLSLHNE